MAEADLKDAYLRYANQQYAQATARLEYAVAYSRSGLHAALLANGGALIGLFTLIAPHRDLATSLWSSGLAFVAGLALTLVAWLLATYAQDKLQVAGTYRAWNYIAKAEGRNPEFDDMTLALRGNRCIMIAYGVFVLALVAFVAGCLLTLRALA